MTFERSEDYAAIRTLLTEPRCVRRMAGGAPSPELPADLAQPGIEYVLARDGAEAVAVFVLVDGEVHFCFSPAAWGTTRPIAQGFLQWVWTHTDRRHLLGPVPAHNRLAIRLARAVGFTVCGKANGLVLLEIRKPQ